jgi:HNH endonuclease
MYNSTQVRRCTKCFKAYPLTPENFGQRKPGHPRSRCRECEKERCRDYGRRNDRSGRDAKRRQLDQGVKYSNQQKKAMHARQHGMCLLCAKPLIRIDDCSVDHMVPVTRGGGEGSNLHLVHKLCNTDKYNRTVEEHWQWRVTPGFDLIPIGEQLLVMKEKTERGKTHGQ